MFPRRVKKYMYKYLQCNLPEELSIEQGQKDFAVILAKNRGTATSQTRLIRG